ncbi:hypothetical protein GCM10022268_09990 [Sphingomonas cynarae]|uniref:Uncharacterized protein n=1 Tax=Sphingomonas cynarae TaxID=930197 RepID=A0ABP7D8L5_9SPHN
MTNEQEQIARDQWQTSLYEASYRYSVALKELHQTNPWPDHPALTSAIDTLATELWDRSFRASDISAAFERAIAGLPAYTAGDDIRP